MTVRYVTGRTTNPIPAGTRNEEDVAMGDDMTVNYMSIEADRQKLDTRAGRAWRVKQAAQSAEA